jgi:ABC-type transporter Mla MlaB component
MTGAKVLRITQEGDAARPSLKLEGRLEGAWVEVLRKAWSELVAPADGHKAVVDLGSVSFADREGRALLLEMQKKGAVLAKASGFMRHILAEGDDSEQKGE